MAAGKIKMGSNRSFGLVFAAVFGAVALVPLWRGHPLRLWALVPAAAFLTPALIRPGMLAPLNRLWFRLGLAIGKVMGPVAMAVLFAIAIVPTALVLRLLGKDPLQRRLDRSAKTYWELRERQPGAMSEQY